MRKIAHLACLAILKVFFLVAAPLELSNPNLHTANPEEFQRSHKMAKHASGGRQLQGVGILEN